MATRIDPMESSDNNKLEHDDANSQTERLCVCSASKTRTISILTGKVSKDRHMDLWVRYM